MHDILTKKILKRLLKEAKISASPDYMKKEVIREKLQKLVIDEVAAGKINSQEELASWWSTAQMSIDALKMVPFEAWRSGKSIKK